MTDFHLTEPNVGKLKHVVFWIRFWYLESSTKYHNLIDVKTVFERIFTSKIVFCFLH